MLLASVIICTYNPRPGYLRRVFEALRRQTVSPDAWELILVDNGSDEPLTSTNWNLSWHPHVRHVSEEKLGVTFARLRGTQEATADILIFVDDDNLLAPDYLEQALRINREWPMLGIWGSAMIKPEFEVRPSDELLDYLPMLALRNEKTAQWSNVMPCLRAIPWGAGQCLRARVALAYREYFETSAIKVNSRNSRSRQPFHGGEDVEMGYVACTLGLGVGIFPELTLMHLIPKERSTEAYIIRLVEGITLSNILLQYKWQGTMPISPFSGAMGIPRVLRNLLARRGIRRRMYLAELRSLLRGRAIILELPGGKV